MKQLVWLGTSLLEVREFPAQARGDLGYQLYKVQCGLEPSDWKPVPSVGIGVREIRIHAGNEYRVLYVTQFAERVYVLHAFAKKTWKTEERDIELARKRLKSLRERR